MITYQIDLGENVDIHHSSKVNNVTVGDRCRIAFNVNIFGSPESPMSIGDDCYIGPYCFLEGFNARVTIGKNVSFAQRITLISGSAPNASKKLQRIFPAIDGPIHIGDDCWIGAHSVIMPNVTLGTCCIVGVNSFVNKSFPDYSIIGGCPAVLIRRLTEEEIRRLND